LDKHTDINNPHMNLINGEMLYAAMHSGRHHSLKLFTRAGRYIARYCYAHLISKAGSLISSKSPSHAFKLTIWVLN